MCLHKRIHFPDDTTDWTKRSVRYSSPAGTRVQSLTVMLSCAGYTGTVSFTDVVVVPDTRQYNNLF